MPQDITGVREKLLSLAQLSAEGVEALDWLLGVAPGFVGELSSSVAQLRSPMISISTEMEGATGLLDSKFGGIPYLPKGAEVPKDALGNPLGMLAQVNCTQLPKNDFYPSEGILQFWIGRDDMYGLEPVDLTGNRNSRVIYYESLESGVTAQGVLAHYAVPRAGEEENWPLRGTDCCGMRFDEGQCEMSMLDWQVDSYLQRLITDTGLEERYEFGSEFWNQVSTLLWELFDPDYVRLGGNPAFCVGDPREAEERYRDYTFPLLAIGSDDIVEFAEIAEVNFLIRPADLAKRDFSRVLYYWDCLEEED